MLNKNFKQNFEKKTSNNILKKKFSNQNLQNKYLVKFPGSWIEASKWCEANVRPVAGCNSVYCKGLFYKNTYDKGIGHLEILSPILF